MMRSMFSGVSGLKTHQTKMDVVGNNIANVNTVGYKRSTVTFNEMLNQQIRGASAPSSNFFGGTNPMQVGLGVTVGSIDVVHSPGSPQSTGRSMDMSIEGEGYFVIGLGSDNYYTRAGNFGFDSENNLVASNGMKVKGWTAAVDASNNFNLDTSQAISPINLTALSTSQIMQATSAMTIGVNLDSRLPATADSTPATLTGAYSPGAGNLNINVNGVNLTTIVLGGTETINDVTNLINSAIETTFNTTGTFVTNDGTNITITGPVPGRQASVEVLSTTTSTALPVSSATGINTTKTYISSIATGGDVNGIDSTNSVVLSAGEGLVVDGEFSISDGSKLLVLDHTNSDYWDVDPSSGQLTLKDLNDDGFWTGWAPLSNMEINYKKADYQTSMKVYDNQGGAHDFTVTYMKADSNHWVANYAIDGDVISMGASNSYTKDMYFKTNGQIDDTVPQNAAFELPFTFPASSGLDPLSINVDLTNMIQVANENSTLSNIQNGFSPGSLQRISVNQTGQIIGTFSNGENIELAQVALATFSNTSGLSKVGDTLFVESRNSGLPEYGAPGTAGKGSVKPESLEMSNVDLSQEFVDMIITQRGFQANSRIITTSDEMLQELVNLKR
ncbi:MAG: flagellar hook protein FlgE [Eubacteriales bacterium]|nr:flagellar hook protein FlgE [Eubacteriales bacterium]